MLELKNCTIKFDQMTLFDAVDFHAERGKITCIIGDSGCGKTSLLYSLGLLAYYENTSYMFDGKKVDVSNIMDIENFRFHHLSYVLQDNNVINNITVEKNIIFHLAMNKNDESVKTVLERVGLNNKKDVYPPTLSGGERQRLALACALAKDADIFLGDEITSSLDRESKTIIFRILKEMAKENKVVVIVSHDEDIIAQSDDVYKIENGKMYSIKNKEKDITTVEIYHHRHKKAVENFFECYQALFFSNKKIVIKKILLGVLSCILILAGAGIIFAGNQTKNTLKKDAEAISNTELFLINQYDFMVSSNHGLSGVLTNLDGNGQPPFEPEVDEKLKKIENVTRVYEVYNFLSSGMNIQTGKQEEGSIQVFRNDNVVERRTFSKEERQSGYTYNFVVKPYFQEQKWFQKGNDGIYVNEEFAHTYAIETGDVLKFQAYVPVGLNYSDSIFYPNENCETVNDVTTCYPIEKDQIAYTGVHYAYTSVALELPVLDIINTVNTSGGYFLQNNIYMNHDLMMSILNEHKITDFGPFESSGVWLGTFKSLASSVRIMFADKYQSVPAIQKEITSLSPTIAIGYDYQDVNELFSYMHKGDRALLYYGAGLLLAVMILTVGIGYQQMKNYKSQILIMKINGISQKKIYRYFMFDSLMIIFYSMLLIMIMYVLSSLPILFMKPIRLPDWYLGLYSYLSFPPIYLLFIALFFMISAFCSYLLVRKYIVIQEIAGILRGNNVTD